MQASIRQLLSGTTILKQCCRRQACFLVKTLSASSPESHSPGLREDSITGNDMQHGVHFGIEVSCTSIANGIMFVCTNPFSMMRCIHWGSLIYLSTARLQMSFEHALMIVDDHSLAVGLNKCLL